MEFVHHTSVRMNKSYGLPGIELLYISCYLDAHCSSAYNDNLGASYHILNVFLQIGHTFELFSSGQGGWWSKFCACGDDLQYISWGISTEHIMNKASNTNKESVRDAIKMLSIH